MEKDIKILMDFINGYDDIDFKRHTAFNNILKENKELSAANTKLAEENTKLNKEIDILNKTMEKMAEEMCEYGMWVNSSKEYIIKKYREEVENENNQI